jgi:predicted Zn-dependent peptidase
VNQIIDEIMWGDQPIGRPIAGTRETVEAITRDQMLDYMAGHYLPGANLVSVAGHIEHDEVVDAVRASLGAAPSGPVPTYTPATSDQTSQRMRIFNKDTEQAQICIGMPALSYTDPDRYVQQMLDGVLGSGMSSRLFVEIREKRALAYSVASYVESYKDIGAFILYAAVDNERVESCIQGMLHELDRMRQTPVPVEELNKVKEYHKGHMLLALESSRSVAAWGGRQELLLDRIYSVDEVIERIDAVTPEDVQKLAQRIFQEQLLSLSMVGPFEDEERFRPLLKMA